MSPEQWQKLSKEEKIEKIDHLLEEEIRPFIAEHGGGVDVIDLVNDKEVIISYEGACRNCPGAIGGTLSFIQQALQENLSSDLFVTPKM